MTETTTGSDVMTNEKAPERVWINNLPESGRVTAYVSPIREVGSGRSLSLAEYVRADLLAAKVKEEREAAFKDIRDLITTVNPKLTFGSANGSVMKNAILQTVDMFIASEAALKAATLTEK